VAGSPRKNPKKKARIPLLPGNWARCAAVEAGKGFEKGDLTLNSREKKGHRIRIRERRRFKRATDRSSKKQSGSLGKRENKISLIHRQRCNGLGKGLREGCVYLNIKRTGLHASRGLVRISIWEKAGEKREEGEDL